MRLSILLISLAGGIAGVAVTVGLDNALHHIQSWRFERRAWRYHKRANRIAQRKGGGKEALGA